MTALCSQPEITTRLPGLAKVLMAMFSPWVALKVKTTRSGSSTWNSWAAASRHAKAVSAAAMAGLCPPLPGLARWPTAQAAEAATAAGF